MTDQLLKFIPLHGRPWSVVLSGAVVAALWLGGGEALAAAPPEVERINGWISTLTSIATPSGDILAHGLETQWRFEYGPDHKALTEGTFVSPNGMAVAGCSGTISEEEALATELHKVSCPSEVTGLEPGTTYYIRLVAKSTAGEGSLIKGVTTKPRFPIIQPTEAGSVGASSAHIEAHVSPEGLETQWRFEYSADKKSLEEGHGSLGPQGTITAVQAGVNPEDGHKVEGELTGLSAGTHYYVRLSAQSSGGEGKACDPKTITEAGIEVGQWICGAPEILGFETGGPPVVFTFASHGIDVSGERMRVMASVEPHGADTHYQFEYVTQAAFEAEGWAQPGATEPLDAGAGEFKNGVFPTVVVGEDLPADLRPGVSYRFRVIASNTSPGNPVVYGDEQTLTVPTPGAAGEGLEESQPEPCPNESLRAEVGAALPDCRAYEQITPAEKEGAQDVFNYGGKLEGGIGGEDGEHFTLHAPGVEWGPEPDPRIANYFFTRSASGWVMSTTVPHGEPGPDTYVPALLSPNLTEAGLEAEWETNSLARSSTVGFLVGPIGGPYGPVPATISRKDAVEGTEWVAASADFSKLIVQSEDYRLLGNPTGTRHGEDLYEFSGGELRQVNVGIGSCGALIADGFEGYEGRPEASKGSAHAVSADGSRVFFEAVPGSECAKPSHLYMRVDGTETIDIGTYAFLAASADGSRLLLEERPNGETHKYLLYETATAHINPVITTSQDIFQPAERNGGGSQSPVVSSSLSTIYFFSESQLTGDAPPRIDGLGVTPEDLYRLDTGTGELQFIAQSGGVTGAGFKGHSTSSDGRYFYWISTGVAGVPGGRFSQGTGYQVEQVYRYDSSEHVVQCMSCASSFNLAPGLAATFADSGTVHPIDGVPGLRDASDNGDYVFFDTPASLVPGDVDGEVAPEELGRENPSVVYSVSSDVYEWRKNGIDGCAHVQGCLSLITSGSGGGFQNVLLGTTASGRDVFFATHEQLVSGDRDKAGDVYDARIGGGFAPPPPPPVECEAGSCQSPAPAPIDTTPASLSFSGPGNAVFASGASVKVKVKRKTRAKACRKGIVRMHGRCVSSGAKRARRGASGRLPRRARRKGRR